jgi:hypothetical protein
MAQLAAVEGSLETMQDMLCQLLLSTPKPPPALALAAPALALGPDFLAPHPAPKTDLRLNPPAVFDGDQTFLYSVLTYYWLVPEAFMVDGFVSQENPPPVRHVFHVERRGCSMGGMARIS